MNTAALRNGRICELDSPQPQRLMISG